MCIEERGVWWHGPLMDSDLEALRQAKKGLEGSKRAGSIPRKSLGGPLRRDLAGLIDIRRTSDL